MLQISKYKNYLETTEYTPNEEWTQVDTNATALAAILVQIDMLENNECLVITRKGEKKNDF